MQNLDAHSTTSVLEAEHQLVAIEPQQLGEVWDIIEPMIGQVLEGMAGRHKLATLIQEITTGELALWGVVKEGHGLRALVGTQIGIEPSGMKTFVIRFVVGKGFREWCGLLSEVEAYARSQGCHRLETWARKGWARHMPDYKMTHVLLEKDLTADG